MRFLDYLVPIAVIFLAVWTQHNRISESMSSPLLRNIIAAIVVFYCFISGYYKLAILFSTFYAISLLPKYYKNHVVSTRILGGVVIIFILMFSFFGYRKYFIEYVFMQSQKQGGTHAYASAAAALESQLRPNDIVFSASWADNAYLWFGASNLRYLVFLEPVFFYLNSPEKFKLWWDIRSGKTSDSIDRIRTAFGASAVVVRRGTILADQLETSNAATLIHDGNGGEQVFILDR